MWKELREPGGSVVKDEAGRQTSRHRRAEPQDLAENLKLYSEPEVLPGC